MRSSGSRPLSGWGTYVSGTEDETLKGLETEGSVCVVFARMRNTVLFPRAYDYSKGKGVRWRGGFNVIVPSSQRSKAQAPESKLAHTREAAEA